MNPVKTICGIVLGVGVAAGLSDGDVTMQENPNPTQSQRIDVETIVNATLDDVWRAWTTNEGTQSFFAKKTNVSLAIGGPFEMHFAINAPKGQQGSEDCRFLSYLPQEMVSFSWSAPPQFPHARKHRTWVVVRFEAIGSDKVRVKLTHLGWAQMKAAHPDHADEWEKVYQYFTQAWPYVLDNLKKRFDDGPRWD